MSEREFKWQKLSAWLLEMEGGRWFRGEIFGVNKNCDVGLTLLPDLGRTEKISHFLLFRSSESGSC